MKTLSLRSPAKLNLFLKVLNKRSDGYHNIETLFERIDLWDKIRLISYPTGGIRIFCDHPDVPLDSQNLAYQAAKLVKEKWGVPWGIDIKIDKRIPVAAGLGGGSSNAATTLLGLNQIWRLGLSQRRLLALARTLGSDVPFFVQECRWAVGTGRGDYIKPLNLKTRLWHVLLVPSLKLYSKEVFENLSFPKSGPPPPATDNEGLTKPNDDVNILTRSLRKNNLSAVSVSLRNDLEKAIVRLEPSLALLKQKLGRLTSLGLSFSGSGPALVVLAEDRKRAESLKSVLNQKYRQPFDSPLSLCFAKRNSGGLLRVDSESSPDVMSGLVRMSQVFVVRTF